MNITTVWIQHCANCRQPIGPIVLPAPTRLRIFDSPEGSIPASVQLIVACPDCAHVFPYSIADIRRHPPRTADQGPALHSDRVPVRVTRLCGIGNCPAPLTIHTTVANEEKEKRQVFQEVVEVARIWIFDYKCPGHGTHYLSGVSLAAYALDGLGVPPEPSIISNRI